MKEVIMIGTAGIIGYGIVGQATHHILNCNVYILDPYVKGCKLNIKDLLGTTAIFICLNVLNKDGHQDYTCLTSYLQSLKDLKYKGIVVIRSTILPSCEPIMKFKHDLKIVAWPEFLTEVTSFKDEFKDIILGGIYKDCLIISRLLPRDHKIHCMSFNEAMMFKYTRNMFGAYKVLFWEFIQETTGKARKMAELMKYFPSGDYSQVGLDGFRGFGGKCFPKDTLAFHNVVKHPLTKFMLDYNNKLRSRIKEDTGYFG